MKPSNESRKGTPDPHSAPGLTSSAANPTPPVDWGQSEDGVLLPEYRANAGELAEADDSLLPVITRRPDGYEVVEHRVGRAIGQWVLQLRCECGRRWFELEEVDTTSCPRCGLLVYVTIRE